MSLVLARGETILFPMPYVEAERPPYVVTNQRLVERGPEGERTLQVRQLATATRAKARPHAAIGAVLLCIGLGIAAVGAYEVFAVMGMPAASWKTLWPASDDTQSSDDDSDKPAAPPPVQVDPGALPDDPSVATGDTPSDVGSVEVLRTRVTGLGLLALGLLVALVGRHVFGKLRYFVVCRTNDGGMMRVRVQNKVQQDLILATLQAVK
jgi:hypothetical protein